MPTISIASNSLALRTITEFNRISNRLGSSFEKLSSGLRINRASDDAAGLAVADSLRADAKLAAVAIRNANDAISRTTIADSALGEINNILLRMQELAQQSANGALTNTQRSALSLEFIALGSEIERIAKTTEFNDQTLLSNSSSIRVQVGLDGSGDSSFLIGSVLATLESLNLASSGSSELQYSIIDTTSTLSQSAANNALTAIQSAVNLISTRRGTLGAAENRLNTAINLLTVTRENLVAAESAIRDIDVAEETANMTRLLVLQQSSSAILAQANLQPQIALSLITS